MVYLTVIVLTTLVFCIYKEYITNKQITDLTTKLMARNLYEYQDIASPKPAEPVYVNPLVGLDDVEEDELRKIFNKEE